jgi:parallel beta-helix repeat protein
MSGLNSGVQPVKAASGTIYIRADGSVDPSTAPISTTDNITYTLTGNVTTDATGIIVERNNIVIDGAGHRLQYTGIYLPYGIDLTSRSNVTIRNVKIDRFWVGIYGGAGNNASSNTIYGNYLTNNWYGIGLFTPNNNVTGNSITIGMGEFIEGTGIRLYESSSNKISNNYIVQDNMGNGIQVESAGDNTITGNTIEACDYGIDAFEVWDNTISGNLIAANHRGISFQDCSRNTISGNNIANNTEFGIRLYDSSNDNIVSDNVIANNGVQIMVVASS